METKLDRILTALADRASVKQLIYRNTLVVFGEMKQLAASLANEVANRIVLVDKSVMVEYLEVSEFEFRLKFSGDLLIFTMHSNVMAFPPEHVLSASPYIREDYHRGFFGSIMCYNFMADSVKYNRLNDPGYLLGRILLNYEGHFYIEGVRQLNFLYPDIAHNLINRDILMDFIQSNMLTAIQSDLLSPDFHSIQLTALGEMLANKMVYGGKKLGFQMSAGES